MFWNDVFQRCRNNGIKLLFSGNNVRVGAGRFFGSTIIINDTVTIGIIDDFKTTILSKFHLGRCARLLMDISRDRMAWSRYWMLWKCVDRWWSWRSYRSWCISRAHVIRL